MHQSGQAAGQHLCLSCQEPQPENRLSALSAITYETAMLPCGMDTSSCTRHLGIHGSDDMTLNSETRSHTKNACQERIRSNLAKSHVISEDGALVGCILPEEEVDALSLILTQISVDAARHFKPYLCSCAEMVRGKNYRMKVACALQVASTVATSSSM